MSDGVFVLRDRRIPFEETALHVVKMTLTYESPTPGHPPQRCFWFAWRCWLFESPPIVLRLSTPFKNDTTGSRRAEQLNCWRDIRCR